MFFHDVSWYLWVCFSDLASNLPDLQHSMLTSCHPRETPYSVVFFCLRWVVEMLPMPVHLPASSACRASCSWRGRAIYAITSGLLVSKSGKRSIQGSISLFPVSWNLVIHLCKSIVPLLCFMNCMNRYKNTAWAQLCSLDEMWSQEPFEIVHTVIWVSQQLSVQ